MFLNYKISLVLRRREEMSLMSATLCSRPNSFLRNHHSFFWTSTAASCLQTSKLLASLKVLNTSNQKARFCGWVISVFKNCQNCYKCCALLVNPLDKYLKNPLGKNLTSLRQKLRSQIENNFLDSFSFGSPDLLCFFPLNYFFPNKPFFFFLPKPAASFVRINSAESREQVWSFLGALKYFLLPEQLYTYYENSWLSILHDLTR